MRCSRRWLFTLLVTTLVPASLVVAGCIKPISLPKEAVNSNDYLFCFWNTENLFDDHEDNRQGADKEYDSWFASNPSIRELKYNNLSKAIIAMNDGRGPDILAVAEVESERAAELLRDALNKRVSDPSLQYKHVLMKEVTAGRHIATAVITRLPVNGNKTHLIGRGLRILEAHVEVNGHDLVILASHWTSRLTDKTGEHRDKYADQLYGHFKGMHKGNPNIDLIICGDFNDTPQDESVTKHLHATGDQEAVRNSREEPLLLDLLAGKDPNKFGTHHYRKNWFIFDHIVVSPGMLDNDGWSCDPDSIHTVNTLTDPHDPHHAPWRFGNPNDKAERGYSDHFPVTVRLKVHEN